MTPFNDTGADWDRDPDFTDPDERRQAAELWKAFRMLEHLRAPDCEFRICVRVLDDRVTAEYAAIEPTSGYGEHGHGTDIVSAIQNMHDCLGDACDDPFHIEELDAAWRKER